MLREKDAAEHRSHTVLREKDAAGKRRNIGGRGSIRSRRGLKGETGPG